VPPEPRTFVATTDQAGLTVLAALRQWIPDTSWSAVRKLLAGRHILVNGTLCLDEARRLKAGESVTLCGATLRPPPAAPDVRLVWIDRDVVVVDKPAGMITLRHAVERNWSATKKRRQPALDDLLPELIARRENLATRRRGSPESVYSVHRIDRDTSGLLAFARNVEAQRHLIGQFKQHTVERTYLAVAHGDVAARTIESNLIEDRGDGRRGSTPLEGAGKRAVTHLRPLERLNGFTLLECKLETGRTHQIRIHLSEAGHPLYGDNKYGDEVASQQSASLDQKGGTVRPTSAAFPRLALHAATLGFVHPASGKLLRFESPPPPDFSSLVERLRRPT
jgi:23S rRNA pseudouridine1911/1915/1917 synthase